MSLRQGEIYFVNDCPPLLGKIAAPHRVIILNPKVELDKLDVPLNCVVISASIPNPGEFDVPIPNTQDDPNAKTGCTKPCWAVCTWILTITSRATLAKRSGFIGGATFRRVVNSYIEAIKNGAQPIEHPSPGEIAKKENHT